VSTEAIINRIAKKTLISHLGSVLDKSTSPPQSIQSLRFRSTAFSTTAMPKRVTFIKKSLMDATTKSTNAYVVYSSSSAARAAVSQLNGTIVLDRHLRVDSVAHPAAVDHGRCVFIGNLGFVDDESVLSTKVDEQGNKVTEKKKLTRKPMDVEEGLWRVFGKEAGRVENVRVVRDAATRVGKGFAYVQFYVRHLSICWLPLQQLLRQLIPKI
jgi:nucleolar protein 12